MIKKKLCTIIEGINAERYELHDKIVPYGVVPLHRVEFVRDASVIFFVVSPNSLMLPFAGLLLNVFLPHQLVLQRLQSCLSAMQLVDH